MVGPVTKFEELARDAAERITAAKAAGEQLTFLPDEPQPGDAGRTPRGKGKATSQMREWLATKGYRLPEDVLAEMAGLASTEDAFLSAMARTEQVLAWAEAGATGYKGSPSAPSTAQRLATFQFVFTAQLRSLEAMLPYGLAKVTPDAAPQAPVQVFVAGGQTAQVVQPGPAGARDVTPQPRRVAPPPMPMATQGNQGLSAPPIRRADDGSRTDEVTP
jgi:hypothetical protein